MCHVNFDKFEYCFGSLTELMSKDSIIGYVISHTGMNCVVSKKNDFEEFYKLKSKCKNIITI